MDGRKDEGPNLQCCLALLCLAAPRASCRDVTEIARNADHVCILSHYLRTRVQHEVPEWIGCADIVPKTGGLQSDAECTYAFLLLTKTFPVHPPPILSYTVKCCYE